MNKKTPATLVYGWIGAISILGGTLLRAISVALQPLWLDEKYSIFFATQYSARELLFHFNDINHGLFYFLLKLALSVTTDLTALRVMFGILPYTIGAVLVFMTSQRTRRNALLLVLLSFNPFLIHYGWQLRMYGLVIVSVIISLVLLDAYVRHRRTRLLLLLCLNLIVGNMLAYTMYIFTVSIALYLIGRSLLPVRHKLMALGGLAVLVWMQFSLFSVFNPKQEFVKFSWIPLPTFANLPAVSLTPLGLQEGRFPVPAGVLFYGGLVAGAWLIRRLARTSSYSGWTSRLIHLVIAPYVFVIATSLVIPFLAHRRFFHVFVPDVSFFLPRVFLPQAIALSFLVAEIPIQIRRRAILICCAVAGVWIFTNQQTNIKSIYVTRPAVLSRLISTIPEGQTTTVVLWPEWMYYELIVPQEISRIAGYHRQSLQTEQFFSCIINTIQYDQYRWRECTTTADLPSRFFLIIKTGMQDRLVQVQDRIHNLFSTVCRSREDVAAEGGQEQYSVWECTHL